MNAYETDKGDIHVRACLSSFSRLLVSFRSQFGNGVFGLTIVANHTRAFGGHLRSKVGGDRFDCLLTAFGGKSTHSIARFRDDSPRLLVVGPSAGKPMNSVQVVYARDAVGEEQHGKRSRGDFGG